VLILQWAGFLGTFGGYCVLAYRSQFWGAFLSLCGVSALGTWAALMGAWPVVALECSFVLVNCHVMWRNRG
jgi:hypothetical protein